MKHTLVLVLTLVLTACGSVPSHYSDPELFQQIPNQDNYALRVCGKPGDRC